MSTYLKGGRYEIREILGQGGMGVVYKVYDSVIRREVALKTIRDSPDHLALEMFYKECNVLAGITHPNIVEIYDIGELEEGGGKKPYFVMPLLPGVPLDQLIRGSERLTAERTVEILCQTCRGLHAAHERGLVHRDIKPSNIFVLRDDSVKIIDFGVAHMTGAATATAAKGTLFYMAPEQFQMKPPSALTDLFSLAVVAYQAFTGRRPFDGTTETEVAQAILYRVPPPVSELNPAVNEIISRVVHKAMAKQPWHRFGTAREFAEALQKGLRNEGMELFDPSRIRPRVERAARAFEQGDHQFASEILSELEAEGYLDSSISLLRRQIDHTLRHKTIRQLLESARTRMGEDEYPLALQKVQEALQLDPDNGEALGLREAIEKHRSQHQVEEWFRLARQHMETLSFSHARQALANVLEIRATDTHALELMTEVERREREYLQMREEKQKLFQAAMSAYERAELSTALSRLEKLLQLDRQVPEVTAPERSAAYQNLYNQVRSERDAMMAAYAESRRALEQGNLTTALELCEEFLRRYPAQALFQALKFEIEEKRRQSLSSYIVEIDQRAAAEPDLDKRVEILRAAVERFPGEEHFERALRLARDKSELVRSIETKARHLEEQQQFAEALGQWDILRTVYNQFPGLDFETERVTRRLGQQLRSDAKARWVEQVDRHLEAGEYDRALGCVQSAAAEFPGDPELAELEKLARQGIGRAAESQALLAEGQTLCAQGRFAEGVEVLRRAHALDERNPVIRAVLVDTLLKRARAILDEDWRAAGDLVEAALRLDPANNLGRSLQSLIADRNREEQVEACVARARQLQASGDLAGALETVEQGIRIVPSAPRLNQLQALLRNAIGEAAAPPPALAPAPPAASATPEPQVMRAAAGASATEMFQAPPPPMEVPQPPPSAPPPPAVRARKRPAWLPWAAAGAATILVLGVIAGVVAVVRRNAAARTVSAEIRTAPAGAAIIVDGKLKCTSNCRMDLAPGTHRVEASKPGYRPAAASLAVAQNAPAALDLTLDPLPSQLRIFTDLEKARVLLDGQAGVELQGGQLVLDSVAPGRHRLEIEGSHERAVLEFDCTPGAAPVLAASPEARDVAAIVVTGMGETARVYSTLSQPDAAVDGKPAGAAGPAGIELGGLAPGSHELALGGRKVTLDAGPNPALTLYLNSDRDVGTLVVQTGEDDVSLWIDGKLYRRTSRRGQLRISNLPSREYTIRAAKQGFVDAPEQRVTIRKGEDSRLLFELKPLPTTASLAVEGALPGSQLLLDGNPAGSVGPEGSLFLANLPPGEHRIELRRDQYHPRVLARAFKAGETVKLTGSEVVMEKIPPPAPKPAAPKSAPAAKPAAPVASGMEGWLEPGAWTEENGWHMRKGGNLLLYRETPRGGVFQFTILLQKGKRLRWVARCTGPRDYALFEMDDKHFYRRQVSNGKNKELEKKQHGIPKQGRLTFTLQVHLTPGSIVHKLHFGERWVTVDDWQEPGFTDGAFGLLIQGKDEVGLSHFAFTPR